MIETVNVILIVFVCACAFAAVRVRELVGAVFILGCYSFFLAVLWSLLNAADVSFTEAMVGAGASTIFLLLALMRTSHTTRAPVFRFLPGSALAVTLALAALFIWGSSQLPLFGDPLSPASQYVSPYYLEHTFRDAQTPNAVTAVVTDYRGFDTLIETTVIFTAGIACLLIMRRKL